MALAYPMFVGVKEGEGIQIMAIDKAEKSLWLIGSDGEVRVGDGKALAREAEALIGDEEPSDALMGAYAGLFFAALSESGYEPDDDMRRELSVSVNIRALGVITSELRIATDDDDDVVEDAVEQLSGMLIEAARALVDDARSIGGHESPDVAVGFWAVGAMAVAALIHSVMSE